MKCNLTYLTPPLVFVHPNFILLGEIARTANEEVKLQNKMLDTLEEKVDDVHEHLTNVNIKLKNTLDEARKSDKICCDILCLLLLVGMIVVVVEVSNQKKAAGQ